MCSTALCLWPTFFDRLEPGFWYLADFRQWAWWYFIELVVVLAFSVRWFLLYASHVNDELAPDRKVEAVAFVRLTGFLSGAMFVFSVLHRAGIVRRGYYSLYAWFGYGAFSAVAILSFTVLFSCLLILVFLFWKWLYTLKNQ